MKLQATNVPKGCRIDVWLDGQLSELSRSRIQQLIRSGHITVAGKITKAHRHIAEGMIVEVEIPPAVETELIAEDIPLDVIHEDTDIVVINKPPGLVVHPAAGHQSGTLVNAVLYHCGDLKGVGGELRPGIVHRLDKDTSGAIVVAKNETALEGLAAQFKAGQVSKKYTVIVVGVPGMASDRIETLIGRSVHNRKRMSVHPQDPHEADGRRSMPGRIAITNYEVKDVFDRASVLDVSIETGRTHQIRVHLAHIGHPVVGDREYGGRKWHVIADEVGATRQMLHARELSFVHPKSGIRMNFVAPIAQDIEAVMRTLRDM